MAFIFVGCSASLIPRQCGEYLWLLKKYQTIQENLFPRTIKETNIKKSKHSRQDGYIPIPLYQFYAKQALNAQILTKNKPQMKNSYGTYSKMISCAKINIFKRKIYKKRLDLLLHFLVVVRESFIAPNCIC